MSRLAGEVHLPRPVQRLPALRPTQQVAAQLFRLDVGGT